MQIADPFTHAWKASCPCGTHILSTPITQCVCWDMVRHGKTWCKSIIAYCYPIPSPRMYVWGNIQSIGIALEGFFRGFRINLRMTVVCLHQQQPSTSQTNIKGKIDLNGFILELEASYRYPHLNIYWFLFICSWRYVLNSCLCLASQPVGYVRKKQNKKGMGTICIIQILVCVCMRDAAAAVISPIFCSIPNDCWFFFQCQG